MPLGMAQESGLHRKRTRISGKEMMERSALPQRQGPQTQPIPFDHPQYPQLIEAFAQEYLVSRYEDPKPIPQAHREWWGWFCGAEDWKAMAAPRGHAKSTALTHAALLAVVMFRTFDYPVIVSATYKQAIEFLRTIMDELMENERLQVDFQIKTFDKATEDELIVRMADGYKFRISARGVDQPIRGLKWGSKRPNLFLLDDVEDDEAVESKERREKLADRVHNSLIPAGSDRAKTRHYGTIMHFDSLLENHLKAPSWHGIRYRAHEGYDDFTNILWPEKFPESRLRAIRQRYIEQGNPDGYSQEYLNHPISEQDAYFRRTDILPIPKDVLQAIRDGEIPLRKYAGWDGAFSKEERKDYSVCVVVGVDELGNKYVLDIRRGRWDTKEFAQEVFAVETEHRPDWHGMEKGGHYLAIQPYLDDLSRRRSIYPQFIPIPSHKDKRIRAKVWQGAVAAHHVFYDTDLQHFQALFDEMVRFPKGEHDDTVDAQAIIGRLLEDVVAAPTGQELYEEDQDEARDWLRKYGTRQGGRNTYTGY